MQRWTRIAAPPRPTRETNGGNRCVPKHWQARDRAPPATRRPRGSRRTGPSRAATDARKLLALRQPALALRLLRLLQRQRPVIQAIRGRVAFVLGARRGDQLSNPIGRIPRGPECHACFCCFGCLAAVTLAWAIFVFRTSTRRSAPLIGIARGSSTPDWLRGVRITAFPLESISILMPATMVATFWL